MSTPVEQLERVTDEPVHNEPSAYSEAASQPKPSTPADPLANIRLALNNAFTPKTKTVENVAPPVQAETPEASIIATEANPEIISAIPDAIETAPTPPQYFTRISELAEQPLETALPLAVESLKEYAAYDPQAEELLFRSVYAANKDDIHRLALVNMGIAADKVNEFVEWVKNGAQALPMPPAPQPFPEANEDGIAWVNGVAYDLNDPTEREVYEDKKFIYEAKIEKQMNALAAERAEAEKQQRIEQEKQEQRQNEIYQRSRGFMQETVEAIASKITTMLPQLAQEDAWKGEAAKAYAFAQANNMLSDPNSEVAKMIQAAKPYVEQGAGKAKEYQTAIINALNREATKAIDQFNRFILQTNKAEIAATATQPKYPEGTKTVAVVTPEAPTAQKPQNREQAVAQGLDAVRARLSQMPTV